MKVKENDEKIKQVAEEGTQNILDVISDKCKIIMPSSHVVYEGMEKVKNDIQEKMKKHHQYYLMVNQKILMKNN